MKFDSLMIAKPSARPLAVRSAWGVVTALCWALYAYLWLPMLTLLLWMLGLHTAALELYLRNDAIDPLPLLMLPMLATAAAVVLISWAEFNRKRFSQVERRNPTPNVDGRDVARAIGAPEALLGPLHSAKVATVRMDDAARPWDVVVGATPDAGGGAASAPLPHAAECSET